MSSVVDSTKVIDDGVSGLTLEDPSQDSESSSIEETPEEAAMRSKQE